MLSPAEAENSVREALKMGYRLVDTANAYVNERAVGRGMRDSFTSISLQATGLPDTVSLKKHTVKAKQKPSASPILKEST